VCVSFSCQNGIRLSVEEQLGYVRVVVKGIISFTFLPLRYLLSFFFLSNRDAVGV
jgi:hypothetical protein